MPPRSSSRDSHAGCGAHNREEMHTGGARPTYHRAGWVASPLWTCSGLRLMAVPPDRPPPQPLVAGCQAPCHPHMEARACMPRMAGPKKRRCWIRSTVTSHTKAASNTWRDGVVSQRGPEESHTIVRICRPAKIGPDSAKVWPISTDVGPNMDQLDALHVGLLVQGRSRARALHARISAIIRFPGADARWKAGGRGPERAQRSAMGPRSSDSS